MYVCVCVCASYTKQIVQFVNFSQNALTPTCAIFRLTRFVHEMLQVKQTLSISVLENVLLTQLLDFQVTPENRSNNRKLIHVNNIVNKL